VTKAPLRTARNGPDAEPAAPPRDEMIIRRAARAFRERSYHGASMQQIAVAAGIQKSTLYHHFASKDDILLRILEEAVEILLRPLEDISAREIDPAEKLRLAVTNHVRALCEHADLLAVLLFETRTFSRKIERQIKPQRDRYNTLLLAIIKDGSAQGRFRTVDPRIALYGIFGMCNWVCQWYRPKGPISPADLAREYADLALTALEPKK
jgi:AcrR family transcriptional regulator